MKIKMVKRVFILTSWGNGAMSSATTIPRKAEKFVGILKDLCRDGPGFVGGHVGLRLSRVQAEERFICVGSTTARSFLQRAQH